MTLAPGTRLGPYEITARLGEGGMGVVYRARDERLGREVAVKVLHGEVAEDAERLRRFEQEARAASALNHPNILTVHDVGSSDGVAYLVTELLEGESLRERMSRGPISIERSRDLAVQVARGLAAAHRKGIVHRDLKPENLFITVDGGVKILDFGLARVDRPELASSDLGDGPTVLGTSDGVLLGTVGYMAPEQVRGERADQRSDLFALGVVLHEMLSGANPFRRASVIESLNATLKEEPSAPERAGDGSDFALRAIVGRCLEKDAARRFQSASDLAFALDSLSDAGTRIVPAVDSASGRRWPIVAAAAAVLVVVAVGWMVARRNGSAPPDAAPTPIRSLAVLPFDSLSADSADEYFTAGMTDALSTELARLAALKVIARSSSARFRETSLSAAEVAGELGVEALVSGSVVRAGERVRISAQLVEGRSERVVWAESYERAMSDVLSLQAEVARAIAGAVALQLTPDEEQLLAEARPVDPKALDEYLRGRFLWARRTEAAVAQGLAHFRASIEIAPDFALGYAGIADAYILSGAYGWMQPREAARTAFEALDRALALDPSAGEPHASRGDLAFHVEHDFELGAEELDRAIELSPGYATAYYWRAEITLAAGQMDESARLLERAVELAPFDPFAGLMLARVRARTGRLEESEALLRGVLEHSPSYNAARHDLMVLLVERNRPAEALEEARHGVDVEPSTGDLVMLAVVLGLTGEVEEARAVLARLRELIGSSWYSPLQMARVEAAIGDRDAAIADLWTAYEERVFGVPALKHDTPLEFRSLVGDPEFERLRAAIGSSGES